jgi:hypothetical protein
MYTTIRHIVALQALVLTAAAGPSGLGQSMTFGDSPFATPVGEFQPVVGSDTPNGIPAEVSAPEIGALAQAPGAARGANDNFPPAPSRSDTEGPTLNAIKALSEQVKLLESRIAAQDARIATLERSLDDMQRRSSRYN